MVAPDPFVDIQPDKPPVPKDSPIPELLREAITWARQNGVIEMEIPAGRFILKPAAPPHVPTMEDLKASKPKLAPGGYPEDVLFAAVPTFAAPTDAEAPKD